MLPDLIRRGRQPAVGITVHAATITLRITAEGRTAEQCYAAMQPTVNTIHECLDNLVFGEEDDELEDIVVRLLAERGHTLATVEAGTAGMMAKWLSRATDVKAPPQGSGFQGGLVLCSPHAAATLLGADLPIDVPTSEAFARAAAAACRERFATDYALSMGFFPDEAIDSSGTATTYYFALARSEMVICRSGTLVSHPAIWKPRAAKQALNLLRLALGNVGDAPGD
jgi:nicotinamide-nucleotide amidase